MGFIKIILREKNSAQGPINNRPHCVKWVKTRRTMNRNPRLELGQKVRYHLVRGLEEGPGATTRYGLFRRSHIVNTILDRRKLLGLPYLQMSFFLTQGSNWARPTSVKFKFDKTSGPISIPGQSLNVRKG